VFLVDTNKFCFVWVGGGASPTEKKSGLGYAHVSCVFIQSLNTCATVIRCGLWPRTKRKNDSERNDRKVVKICIKLADKLGVL